MKKWIVRPWGNTQTEAAQEMCNQWDFSPLSAAVLAARGITGDEAEAFLLAGDEESLSDPFLAADMGKAVEIINLAIEDGTRIGIFGDYDCDGIVSTSMLYNYLACMGGMVEWFLPERDDGYGLTEERIRSFNEAGIQLLITVDNGISAHKEIALAKSLGMTVVVTDHHQPSETLPEADAIVDLHRSDCPSTFKELCGAGVVLKLMAALDGGSYTSVLEQFGEQAAIATVGDLVKLTGENRTIVKLGLGYLKHSEHPGLQALMSHAGCSVDTVTARDLAFSIVPRLNASGRFGSPTLGVKLLITEDPDEADELAEELTMLNNRRKATEQEILNEVEAIIKSDPKSVKRRILMYAGEGWHHGVIGIVAAKLVERYGKPCLIITKEGTDSRGSMRGVEGFSVYECLNSASDLLSRFGGHMGAGGLTVETALIPQLEERIQAHASDLKAFPRQSVLIDKQLAPSDLTVESVKSLDTFEPFGSGFAKPIFAAVGGIIGEIKGLSEGKHTRITVKLAGTNLTVLAFGTPPTQFPFGLGERADMLMTLETNTYNGRSSVVGKLIDIRANGFPQPAYFAALDAYERYALGEGAEPKLLPRMTPSREELALVYRVLKETDQSLEVLFTRVMAVKADSSYCKLRLSLDIFEELGLVSVDLLSGTAKRLPVTKKAELDSSKILQELRCALHA